MVEHLLEAWLLGEILDNGLQGWMLFGEVFLGRQFGDVEDVHEVLELASGVLEVVRDLLYRLYFLSAFRPVFLFGLCPAFLFALHQKLYFPGSRSHGPSRCVNVEAEGSAPVVSEDSEVGVSVNFKF